LRTELRELRAELRDDARRMGAKLDEHIAAIGRRCATCGEELAVLKNHDRERDRRVDRRIAIGVLVVAAVSLLIKVL
jgi:hypothetical protein